MTNANEVDAELRFGHPHGSLFESDEQFFASMFRKLPETSGSLIDAFKLRWDHRTFRVPNAADDWTDMAMGHLLHAPTWAFDSYGGGWRRLGPPCPAPFTLDLIDAPIVEPADDIPGADRSSGRWLYGPPVLPLRRDALSVSDLPLPQNDHPTEDAFHNPADVLQKIYMSDADDKLPPGVLRLLTRYLERDEEDRRNGRTREHHEKMLQRVIDEQQAMRLEMTRRDGEIANQFMAMRIRQEGFETTLGKLDTRVEKLEGKVEDVAETTGNFQIDTLTASNKRFEKWWFLIGGALIATALTIAGDLIIHALSTPPAVHVESPAK